MVRLVECFSMARKFSGVEPMGLGKLEGRKFLVLLPLAISIIFFSPKQIESWNEISEAFESEVFHILVNKTLVSYKVQTNHLHHLFSDSTVEHDLDSLFSLDGLGQRYRKKIGKKRSFQDRVDQSLNTGRG